MTTDPWTIPDADEILPHDAPREQWLAARRAGIGGSDMPLLMGVANPAHGGEYDLWLDKTGRDGEDTGPTHAMTRGTWLEPHLIDHFGQRTGIECRPIGLCRSHAHPVMQYSADTMTGDGGIAEIKSVGEYAKIRHEWRGGGVARAPYVQMQAGMLVTGRYPGWLVAYEIDQAPMIRGPFAPDRDLHARMIERATSWWKRHVIADAAPAVNLATITDDEIRKRWPRNVGEAIEAEWPDYVRALLADRATAHTEHADGEARKKRIDAELRIMAGDYAALTIGGTPVVTFAEVEGGPKVAVEMEWEEPEMWAKYVSRPHTRRINIVKGK